jgi:hypothetical protein
MAPLIRRLERFGLYSQTIYNFLIREFPRYHCSFRRLRLPGAGFSVRFTRIAVDPRGPVDRDVPGSRVGARGAEAGGEWPVEIPLGLGNSLSQGSGSRPIHGGTFDSPPHGFQIFHFDGATSALPKVLLAPQRIRHVQFSVEKRMQNEFPFRTGTGCTHPAFGAKRLEHRDAHQGR